MIVFANIDGSLSTVVQSVITQGSNNVQSITFIANALSSYSTVEINFKLPNNQIIYGGVLTPQEISFDGNLYKGYVYKLSNTITNFNGTVNVGFSINDSAGNKLKTYTAQFSVIKTNKPVLPEVPDDDWYESILTAFAYLIGKIDELEGE